MIILSCKFIFFMRPFGRNTLKVFATLLFDPLSTHVYVVMLVRFYSLQYAPLYVKKTLNGTQTVYVWSFDGNTCIPYFGLKHITFFSLIGGNMLAFDTILHSMLTFHSVSWWYLHWVEKLRPFFEALVCFV